MIWLILSLILDAFLAYVFIYGVWFLCKNFKVIDWQVIVIRIILAIVVAAFLVFTIRYTVNQISQI